MIRTLAWKEFREHQLVWVAMLALALGSVLGGPWALSADGYDRLQRDDFQLVQAMALLAVGGYGLVCGAMMFAGEREGGTLVFLDSLTGQRRGVWGVKFLVGLLFVLVFGLLSAAGAALVGLETHFWTRWSWLFALPAIAVDSFCWGLLGSALARSTMAAVCIGAISVSVSWMPMGAALLEPDIWHVAVITRVFLALIVTLVSHVLFTRQDLQRTGVSALISKKAIDTRGGTRVLLWLVYRQMRWELLVLLPVAVVGGFLLSGEVFGVWALGTLLLGVLSGTGVFSGEQRGGYERFLGDQRLPIGSVWRVKLFSGLFTAASLAVALGLIGLCGLLWDSWRGVDKLENRPDAMLWQQAWFSGTVWTWMVVWLAHGFASGLFFGMLFRKGLVAVVLAVLFATVQVGLWVPSLLTGGLSWWTVLVPPIVLIIATRLTVWAWVTDSVATRRPVLMAVLCVALAFTWQIGWLGWRVVEVPALGEPFDLEAYRGELAQAGQSRAGPLLLEAGAMLSEWDDTVTKEMLATTSIFGKPDSVDVQSRQGVRQSSATLAADLLNVPDDWPGNEREYAKWINRLFEGEWASKLEEGLRQPLGLLASPYALQAGLNSNWNAISSLHNAGTYLLVRARSLQREGEHSRSFRQIELALALSRQQRSGVHSYAFGFGRQLENNALVALESWVRSADPKKESLERAVRLVEEHVRLCPRVEQGLKMDYLLLGSGLDKPEQLLANLARASQQGLSGRSLRAYMSLVAVAHRVPWERERARRIADMLYHGYVEEAQSAYAGVPRQVALDRSHRMRFARYLLERWKTPSNGMSLDEFLEVYSRSWLWQLTPPFPSVRVAELLLQCRRSATRLKLALWLYQIGQGKFPDTLDALVPKYIDVLPSDPFDGGSPLYRLSTGERLKRARLVLRDSAPVHSVVTADPGDVILQFGASVRVGDFSGHFRNSNCVDAVQAGVVSPEAPSSTEVAALEYQLPAEQGPPTRWDNIGLLYHVPKLQAKTP